MEPAPEIAPEHPELLILPPDVIETTGETERARELKRLFQIIQQLSGVDFSGYKPGTIRRRIVRRMALKRLEHLGDYVDYLSSHSDEAEALYQDLLINVTSFFRNPQAFDTLKKIVFPSLLKDRLVDEPIRVWVPGCSTGEEAYSYAICLAEYLQETGADFPVRVFGTDVNEASIKRARIGIYKPGNMAEVSPARLRRFFRKTPDGYQIVKNIRERCIFARQNLLTDPPLSKMDIVSCRNLLIYLGPVFQRRVVAVLHYALKPNGYLMLGTNEGLAGVGADLFQIAGNEENIFTKRPVPSPHFSSSFYHAV